MARVKGFAEWQPQKRTLPLLADIEQVLEEYRLYLPLTVRQVFYRLVGKGHPKSENFYDSVQDKCNRARRAGLIPFSSIRDDGVSRLGGETHTYNSPHEYYSTHDELYNHYTRSLHADQPAFVSVLCEAAGMVPMINRAIRRYRVVVASSSGFDSLTVKYDLFDDAMDRWEDFGQSTILLHLGDHDPSGVSIHESMAEDLEVFCADRGASGLIELRRVALTPEQIFDLEIPTQPDAVKPSDSRSKTFIERGLEPAAQLEAVAPDVLSAMAREAVENAIDMDAWRSSMVVERQEKAEVQTKLNEVNKVLRDVFDLD